MTFKAQPEFEHWEVRRLEPNKYIVEGKLVEILVARASISNEYSLRRLHKQLERLGVLKELKNQGAAEGDTVEIRDIEFEYKDEDAE